MSAVHLTRPRVALIGLCASLALGLEPLANQALAAEPQGWRSNRLSTSSEKNGRETRALFQPVIAEQRDSIVRFLDPQSRELVLGTVVAPDGWVLTKASALEGFELCLLPDGRRVEGELYGLSEEHDVALVRLAADDLRPIRWSTAELKVGQWLVTPDGRSDIPAALGVLSVEARRIPPRSAVLGIFLEREDPIVSRVLPETGAEAAGLRAGDWIRRLDDEPVATSDALRRVLRSYRVGRRVRAEVVRDGQVLELEIPLSPRDPESDEQMLGGDLSYVRSGFPLALQHDTPLHPRQCGGPLLDSYGAARAINIARASRTASFAIPAGEIMKILPDMLAGKMRPGPLTSAVDSGADNGSL